MLIHYRGSAEAAQQLADKLNKLRDDSAHCLPADLDDIDAIQLMPKDAIERAIKKGVGSTDGEDYSEIRYEGYGPSGVAVIVECLTDNKNRTASEVRTIFGKNGGNLGETGSVGFMFDRIGEIIYPADKSSADEMFESGVEAGASNVESDDEFHSVTTETDDFGAVLEALTAKYGEPERSPSRDPQER